MTRKKAPPEPEIKASDLVRPVAILAGIHVFSSVYDGLEKAVIGGGSKSVMDNLVPILLCATGNPLPALGIWGANNIQGAKS